MLHERVSVDFLDVQLPDEQTYFVMVRDWEPVQLVEEERVQEDQLPYDVEPQVVPSGLFLVLPVFTQRVEPVV